MSLNLANNNYNWRINCTDVNNLTGQSNTWNVSVSYTAPDTTPPTYSNFQNNGSTATRINGVVNWSVTLADNLGISGYIFAHNNTGTLTNGSFTAGNFTFVNQTVTITNQAVITSAVSIGSMTLLEILIRLI